MLKYPIHTCLYLNELKAAYAYCCIDDKFALSRIQKHAEQMNFNCVITWQEPYVVKMDDTVQLVLLSHGQQHQSGFEFSGVFKSNGFLRMEFNIQLTHETFPEDTLKYRLFICKNRHVAKAIDFDVMHKQPERLQLSKHVSNQEESHSKGNEENGGHLSSGTQHSANDEIDKSRRELEEYMVTSTKRRFYISQKGRTVEVQGCIMIFPPHAFDKVTPIDVSVSLAEKDIPTDYIALTPILGCSVNGAVLKRPIKVKLPSFEIFEDGSQRVVLVKKSNESSWRNIGDAELDRENSRVEFEVTHFCRHFVGTLKNRIRSVFGRRQITFITRVYYKRSISTFLILTHAFRWDVSKDLTDASYKEVMPTPYVAMAKYGDKITLKVVECQEECSFQVKELVKTKFQPSLFRLPVAPAPDRMFPFTYAVYINDSKHRDFPLALDVDVLKDPVVKEATMQDATGLVGNISVKFTSPSFYEKHSKSGGVYHFAEDKKKGKALIINNSFGGTDNARIGSDHDMENMRSLWEKVGLDVSMEADLEHHQMIETIRTFGQEAVNVGICVLVIMSHGGSDGGSDVIACENGGFVSADDIVDELSDSRCPHLRNIPRLILLECCRGENALSPDDSPEALSDEATTRCRRSRCDTVIAYATQHNYVAFLNTTEGSWFIHAITNIFMRDAHNTNVTDMLTKVNNELSARRRVGSQQQQSEQLIEIKSYLRKTLYLFPGWPKRSAGNT